MTVVRLRPIGMVKWRETVLEKAWALALCHSRVDTPQRVRIMPGTQAAPRENVACRRNSFLSQQRHPDERPPTMTAAPSIMVGLVSDTHGWLDPMLLKAFDGAQSIVHAGDIGKEEVITQLEALAPVIAVKGNIDGPPLSQDLPLVARHEVAGRKIFVLHIAGSPFRPTRDAMRLIREEKPDFLVVGHSHIPVIKKVQETVWINPGAAGRQGFHTERLAMRLHLVNDGTFGLDRVELGPRARAKRI